ncbi:hypothetical protein NL344_28200, partial [Klebsiella pneumoniae]|nr:hypothetical protein [Klebsiella pneumoniae]
ILGGAALTPKFVYEDCQQTYKGQVIYGKDAFADLHFMDQLMAAKSKDQWDDQLGFLDERGQPLQVAAIASEAAEPTESRESVAEVV